MRQMRQTAVKEGSGGVVDTGGRGSFLVVLTDFRTGTVAKRTPTNGIIFIECQSRGMTLHGMMSQKNLAFFSKG